MKSKYVNSSAVLKFWDQKKLASYVVRGWLSYSIIVVVVFFCLVCFHMLQQVATYHVRAREKNQAFWFIAALCTPTWQIFL